MKVIAIVLLCAFAAVQGRSARVSNTKAVASLGENPWIVHLRIAVSTSGFLNTCSGSLISPTWAMTAAVCVEDARFIWLRYGVVNVINPGLVTEASTARLSPDNTIAAISINRHIIPTANISPVGLPSDDAVSETSTFCQFIGEDDSVPGEVLECVDVSVEQHESGELIASSDSGPFDRFNIGAPLVSNGVQIGVLINPSGRFAPTAKYLEWIQHETGIESAQSKVLEAPEETDDAHKIKVVN